MDPDEARIVLRWARHYAAAGRIKPADLAAIEADCQRALALAGPAATSTAGAPLSHAGPRGLAAAPSDGSTTLSQVMHALGGALLAAAAIAAVLLLFPEGRFAEGAPRELQAWSLAVMGAGAAGVGLTLLWTTKNRDLADAFLVAGLACFGMMAMPSDTAGRFLAPAALVLSVALPLVRRGSVLGLVGVLTFTLASFRTCALFFPRDAFFFEDLSDVGVGVWLLLAGALAVTVATGRWMLQERWLGLALAVQPIAIVIPLLWFVSVVVDDNRSVFFERYGGHEIVLALVESVFVAAAIARREGPLLVTAAIVISIDAVVFAFDVGGLEFGVVTLLLVAVAVLGLATFMRKRWSRPATPMPPAP